MKHRRLGHLATLALTVAVSASTAATATAANNPSAGMAVIATVYEPGSAPVPDQTNVGVLEGGNCPLYAGTSPEQHGPGAATAPQINPEEAWDIGTLVSECLQRPIPLSSVTGVTIVDADGSPQLDDGAQLSQADLEGQSSFPPGELPVVTDDGDGLIYERPWRGGDDQNADDVITINAPDSFNLAVFTGPLFTVTATVSSTSPDAGQRVTFTGTSTGSSGTVSYSWNFGDGTATVSGASATTTFSTPGVYDVTVEATDSNGGGGYGSVQIQVGSAAPATTTHTTTIGPVKSRGSAPGAAAPGKHRRAPVKPPKSKTKSKVNAKPKRHRPKPKHHKPKVATTPISAGSGGGGRAGGSATSTITLTHVSAAAPTPVKHVAQGAKPPASGPAANKPKPSGVVVHGRLLSGVEPVVLSAAEGRTSAGSARQLQRAEGSSAVTAVLAACAVALLLCLGAASELRYIRSAP